MRHRRCAGFSLLELSVVIVVMGIVLAVSVPQMIRFMKSQRLAGARSDLITDLRYARSLASAQGTTYQVRLASSSYSIVCPSNSRVVLRRTLPGGVAISNADTASFYGYGLTTSKVITLRQGSTTRVIRTSANGQVTCD